jgi:hypothetical protein
VAALESPPEQLRLDGIGWVHQDAPGFLRLWCGWCFVHIRLVQVRVWGRLEGEGGAGVGLEEGDEEGEEVVGGLGAVDLQDDVTANLVVADDYGHGVSVCCC